MTMPIRRMVGTMASARLAPAALAPRPWYPPRVLQTRTAGHQLHVMGVKMSLSKRNMLIAGIAANIGVMIAIGIMEDIVMVDAVNLGATNVE